MDVLLLCPSGLATGGTEGIHNLTCHLNKVGANAKILYIGRNRSNPQPKEYSKYGCEYLTEFPQGFKGVVVFPEVWGNQVIESKYKDCTVVINWQGVDVYDWNVPERERGLYMGRPDTVHIANSDYAMETLKKRGLNPIKIADCLNDEFYTVSIDNTDRKDVVLYNPLKLKMTHFQETVMARCNTELGIKFRMLTDYSRRELIDIFRHSKLYIDFGQFSGRERLPREAVMCGCCILTSNNGTAGYFNDNSIMEQYKPGTVIEAMWMVRQVLRNYTQCRQHFDLYRDLLKRDKEHYIDDVRGLYEIFSNHTRT